MERWVGKLAIVTGVSSGIGEAITRALVGNGVNVLGLARREDKLKELSKKLEKSKGSFHYAKCDVRQEKDILNAFTLAENKFGGINILVNNAGIATSGVITDTTTENFEAVLDVNVLAPAICIREAIKSMRKNKKEGHIFNINSVAGLRATAAGIPLHIYPASKFALRGMTENLRVELAKNKDIIRLTSIYPGLVKTEILEKGNVGNKIFDLVPYLETKDISDSLIFALSAPPNVQLEDLVITPTASMKA
ncbi:farnesol dehydrogenase-like [Chelonus insularis]|uniref:farnesol dehydrogenase-like n=1 Tax=Chelonus insularis TaxID=460826 RepID=UPI00158A6C91|nr:farnesol dehydrogenase-like [Chelonus insularis]